MRGVGYVHAVVGELQLAAFAYIKALGLVKLQAGKQQEGKQQARELGVRVRTLLLGCHRDVAVLLHELGRHADAAKQWSNALLLLADLERDLSSASPASSPRPAANASSPKPKPPPAAAAWSAERCELQLGLADALLLGTDDKEAERAAGLTRAVLDARVAQLGERHPASVAAAYELARVHRAVSQRQVRCEAGEQADATRQRGEEARDAAGVLDALWLPSLFHFCEGDRKTLADQLALLGQVAAIHHEQREAAMLFERALRTHARALAPAVKAAGEGWEEGEGWEATLRSSAPVEVADVAVYWADALQAGGELPAAERAVCLAAAVMAREAGHAGSAQLQCAQAELASVQAAAQAQAAAEAAAAADGPAAAAATQASAAAVARADLLFAAALGCSRGAVDALPAPLATSPGAQAVGAAGAQQLQEERGRAAEAHARVLKRLAQHLARKASAAGVGEVRVALLAEERLLREELTELEQEHGISWH
ncbi:hypothetical protein T492DRAFT_460734 [Pavlovales sp. CCMP2436]|nr:hypothetical protein T492DRAFT_460734 [Pavlovales sp. CCMP2436]